MWGLWAEWDNWNELELLDKIQYTMLGVITLLVIAMVINTLCLTIGVDDTWVILPTYILSVLLLLIWCERKRVKKLIGSS